MTNHHPPTDDLNAAPSATAERYLEAVFYIEGEGEAVHASRLAEWLGVSQPTVGAMLRRMAGDDLVQTSASKVVTLTARGQAIAARIVRRHRIAERWLTDVLGLDWAAADDEASRLDNTPQTHAAEWPPRESKRRARTGWSRYALGVKTKQVDHPCTLPMPNCSTIFI